MNPPSIAEVAGKLWRFITGAQTARWTLRRQAIEGDPFGKTIPPWASHLAIGGFREQGWTAYDQSNGGKTVATGKWGEQLWIGPRGLVCCTEYPDGQQVRAHLEESK